MRLVVLVAVLVKEVELLLLRISCLLAKGRPLNRSVSRDAGVSHAVHEVPDPREAEAKNLPNCKIFPSTGVSSASASSSGVLSSSLGSNWSHERVWRMRSLNCTPIYSLASDALVHSSLVGYRICSALTSASSCFTHSLSVCVSPERKNKTTILSTLAYAHPLSSLWF